MKKLVLSLAIIASLSGCATPDYETYVSAQKEIATAKSTAETARFNALKEFATTGSDSSKIAAVMALAFANQGAGNTNTQLAAPQPNQALQWASILVPAVTQSFAIVKNADVAIAASNNATATSIATTNGFVGIAGKIQAQAANISTITTSDNHAVTTSTDTATTSTLSGTGVLGSGSYNTTDNHAVTTSPVVQITPVVITPTVSTAVTAVP